MSIYSITYSTVSNLLNVPNKRKTKFIALFASILKPLQWLNNLFADDYINGYQYPDYNAFAVYNIGDRITFTDNRNYEFVKIPDFYVGGVSPTDVGGYWALIQENFIGANDRVKFNSQIIMLEKELNVWYKNPLPANQIYIVNNVNPANFVLGGSGATSSKFSLLSKNSTVFLANVTNFVNSDFTVMVPTALYNTLGTTAANRENNIRSFVNKYKLAGIQYEVQTY